MRQLSNRQHFSVLPALQRGVKFANICFKNIPKPIVLKYTAKQYNNRDMVTLNWNGYYGTFANIIQILGIKSKCRNILVPLYGVRCVSHCKFTYFAEKGSDVNAKCYSQRTQALGISKPKKCYSL